MFSIANEIKDKAPLLPIAASLMIGIAATALPLPAFFQPIPVFFVFLLSVAISILLFRHPLVHTLSICLSTFLLGLLLALRTDRDTQPLSLSSNAAVVVSEASERAKTMRVQLLLVPQGESVTAYLRKDERSKHLKPGDGIMIQAKMREGYHHTLSCFVEADRWQSAEISLRELSLIDRTRITFLRWRHHLLMKYQWEGADDEVYGVLAAMTLGDKSALSKELRDTYAVTGASHILALSGLHLGIVYLLLTTLMLQRGNRQKRVFVQVVLVVAIWAFALLVGMPLSVVRSALMISIFALFSLGNRPHLSVNLLALAAIIILLVSPQALFDIGFQLSFLSVFSILLFMPLMARGRTNTLFSCLGVSVAAQIGTAPLVAYYFGRFSTYFLLTNLVVLPMAYIILLGALLMLIVPVLSPAVFWVVGLLNSVLEMITKIPMASIEGLHPSVVQVCLCYVIVACLYGAWRVAKSY